MKLDRPIVFFDLEATGLDLENERIIEIACIRLNPDGSSFKYDTLVNPGKVIPDEVIELTGITNEDVAEMPAFQEVAVLLSDILTGSDLAGYNAANFDVPLLRAEFARAGVPFTVPDDMVVLDSLEIIRKHEIRSLGWTYKYYFGRDFPDAHRAMNDVEATVDIFNEQASKYELDGSVREIVKTLRHPYLDSRRKFIMDEGVVKICFGRHKDKSIAEIAKAEASYITWMLDNLEPELQIIIRQEMERLDASAP